jgi:hypothetical protein
LGSQQSSTAAAGAIRKRAAAAPTKLDKKSILMHVERR